MADDEVLEGWKAIGNHLGVDARTTQRWETERNLPVHRDGEGPRPRVFAYAWELDTWKLRKPEPSVAQTRRRPSWLLLSAGALACGVIVPLTVILLRSSGQSTAPPPDPPYPRYLWRVTAEGGEWDKVGLPAAAEEVLVSPNGLRVYANGKVDRLIMVIDASKRTVATIATPSRIRTLAIAPDGRTIYAASIGAELYVIDTASLQIREAISTGGHVSDIEITPDGRALFLAMGHQGVRRLLLSSRKWHSVTNFPCPYFIRLDRSGRLLVISYQCGGPKGRSGHDSVELYDVQRQSVIDVISGPPIVGGQVDISPDGTSFWLSGWDACTIPNYDRVGCPVLPSNIFHAFRVSDRLHLRALALPLDAGGAPTFLSDATRVLIASKTIRLFHAAHYKEHEVGRAPGQGDFSGSVSPDGRNIYLTAPSVKDLFILTAEDRSCADFGSGIRHFFTMDGTGHDVMTNAEIRPLSKLRFAPGYIGQSLVLEGSAPAAEIRAESGFRFGQSDSSMAFYFKANNSIAPAPLLNWQDATYRRNWRLGTNSSGRIQFELTGEQSQTWSLVSETRVKPGEWLHVTVTKGDRLLRLYLDGNLEAEVRPGIDVRLAEASDPIRIGWSASATTRLDGLFDELGFWTRTLGPAEIRSLVERRRNGPCRAAAAG